MENTAPQAMAPLCSASRSASSVRVPRASTTRAAPLLCARNRGRATVATPHAPAVSARAARTRGLHAPAG